MALIVKFMIFPAVKKNCGNRFGFDKVKADYNRKSLIKGASFIKMQTITIGDSQSVFCVIRASVLLKTN